jgi:hypothetical protein
MRTTIMMDSKLLLELSRETGFKSKSKAVLAVVQTYLRQQRLKRLAARRGSYKFHPMTAQWRHTLDR